MRSHLHSLIVQRQNELERYRLVLEENNPKKILENGYSIITAENGHVVSSIGDLACGQTLRVSLKDGDAKCLVTEIGSERHE